MCPYLFFYIKYLGYELRLAVNLAYPLNPVVHPECDTEHGWQILDVSGFYKISP